MNEIWSRWVWKTTFKRQLNWELSAAGEQVHTEVRRVEHGHRGRNEAW